MSERLKAKYFFLITSIVLLALPVLTFSGNAPDKASPDQLQALQRYIKQSWHTLKRSNAQLAQAAPDPKFKPMSLACLCFSA
jgi:predicted lipoprotein